LCSIRFATKSHNPLVAKLVADGAGKDGTTLTQMENARADKVKPRHAGLCRTR